MSNQVKEEFDRKICRLTESKVYLNYCKKVCGYDMYLFNMMDLEQLNFVFNSIPLSTDDCVVDIGCGSGGLLSTLVAQKGCKGIGIDQLSAQTVQAKHQNIEYITANIDDYPVFDLHPTITLLVDSIYFSRDMENLLHSLIQIKNNHIYIFFSQYLFDSAEDQLILQKDFTKVAKALQLLKLPYKAIDFSKNERLLYEKSLAVLTSLKDSFYKEGNGDLFEEKVAEQQLGKQLYDKCRASRYLYIV